MTSSHARTTTGKHPPPTAFAGSLVVATGAVAWFAAPGFSTSPPTGPTGTLPAAAAADDAMVAIPLSIGRLPTRTAVPELGIDAPIAEVGVFMQDGRPQRETAWHAAGHRLDSVLPGQPGNMVITGHVSVADRAKLAVFSELDTLASGDVSEVYSGDSVFRYAVSKVNAVAPTAVRVLRSSERSTVTLITWGKDPQAPPGRRDTGVGGV